MKRIYSGNSPYARGTRIAAHECGLGARVEEVDTTTLTADRHPLLAYGPGANVPTLQTDSGAFLFETLVITRYLNEHGNGQLIPSNTDEMLELEGIGSLLMDSLFMRAQEHRREPGESPPAMAANESERAARGYDALELKLAGTAATVNLGTIATVSSLGYANWRHADDHWRAGRDGLARGYDEMVKILSVGDTDPVF
ncbi:MAG: glutathione S-transferase [Gammaproteobacteria bacterium]|jgi:glutathione S-transferase